MSDGSNEKYVVMAVPGNAKFNIKLFIFSQPNMAIGLLSHIAMFTIPMEKYYYYDPNNDPEDGDKIIICCKHSNLTKIESWDCDCDEYRYCLSCIYCSLDGVDYNNFRNYDNSSFIKRGYNDYKRKINYLDIIEPFTRIAPFYYYRKLYEFGYEYAKKKYDFNTLNLLLEYAWHLD